MKDQFKTGNEYYKFSILIISNKMQQYAGIYLLKITLYMLRVSIAPIIRRSKL